MEEGLARKGAEAMLQMPLSPHSDSLLPQGWTDTEATAAWGAGQQVSGWPPCSQGLDDVEAKALPRPQGRASEAPGKVTGSQPVKRWDRSKYPREVSGKGGRPNDLWESPPPCTSQLSLAHLGVVGGISVTPRCSEQA